MHMLFLLMRYYPFIGGALGFAFMQIAIFLRRKVRKTQWFYWGGAVFWFLTVALWIFFRGDIHSDQWIKHWFGAVESAVHVQ